MYVVASFEYSKNLEIAIAKLTHLGIEKRRILALPLDKRAEMDQVFDSMHQSDSVSYLELSTVLATIFMLLGGIYGFVLHLGPILWALFGFIFGAILGFIIDFIHTKKKQKADLKKTNLTEVFLLIHCKEDQVNNVKEILWGHMALGITTYDNEF